MLGNWRHKLLQHAEGKVLELAVGAGANFQYYPSNVKVTAIDFSPEMIKKAKQAAEMERIQTNFILSDIEGLEFPENSFDTIVSTLSFCGYEDPVKMFNQLSRWCKPTGQVLLMEHGISSNAVLSFGQKLINPIHVRLIGCHQKRDIVRLIQDSDLSIQKAENHWKSIFHLIWATPKG